MLSPHRDYDLIVVDGGKGHLDGGENDSILHNKLLQNIKIICIEGSRFV